MREMDAKRNGRALVLGGSMAGLLAARVLSDYFREVTIIERDRYPAEPVPRKGVPQSRHVHVLMLRGQMILEELFPGLKDEMIAAGAHEVDITHEGSWFTPAGWGVRFASGLPVLTFTRDLLDWNVRRRVAAIKNIRFVEEAAAVRLLASEDCSRVTGAVVRSRATEPGEQRGEQNGEVPFRADLVVDASGRGSRAPQWLAALGYGTPEETKISARLGYASRLYRFPAGQQRDWQAAYVQAAPPEFKRMSVVFPVEGDRWLVTLGGGGGDYPPADDAGFLEFARNLRVSMIYDAIKDAEPLSPVYTFRATENRWRHYERMARWPENFIALGDAVCAFNPVYGQGMTIAALGAECLAETLRAARQRAPEATDYVGLSRRFQRALAQVNRAPWLLATGEDYRYRETVGGAPDAKTKLMHRYMNQVVRLTTYSPSVRRTMMEVFHMLKPPTALFRPGVLLRVLRQAVNPPAPASHALRPTEQPAPRVAAQPATLRLSNTNEPRVASPEFARQSLETN